jgi:hypothetical protein
MQYPNQNWLQLQPWKLQWKDMLHQPKKQKIDDRLRGSARDQFKRCLLNSRVSCSCCAAARLFAARVVNPPPSTIPTEVIPTASPAVAPGLQSRCCECDGESDEAGEGAGVGALDTLVSHNDPVPKNYFVAAFVVAAAPEKSVAGMWARQLLFS